MPISSDHGDGVVAEERVTGVDEAHCFLAVGVEGGGNRAVHLPSEPGLGEREVEGCQPLDGGDDLLLALSQHGGQAAEDALGLARRGKLELAPGVAKFDDGQRLHEHRRAGGRDVVNEPLELAAEVGLDREHEAVAARGDEAFLEAALPFGRCDDLFQPGLDALLGLALLGAEPRQKVGGVVEDLAAPAQRAARGLHELVELAEAGRHFGEQG